MKIRLRWDELRSIEKLIEALRSSISKQNVDEGILKLGETSVEWDMKWITFSLPEIDEEEGR